VPNNSVLDPEALTNFTAINTVQAGKVVTATVGALNAVSIVLDSDPDVTWTPPFSWLQANPIAVGDYVVCDVNPGEDPDPAFGDPYGVAAATFEAKFEETA